MLLGTELLTLQGTLLIVDDAVMNHMHYNICKECLSPLKITWEQIPKYVFSVNSVWLVISTH